MTSLLPSRYTKSEETLSFDYFRFRGRIITICDLDYTLVSLNTTNELLKVVNFKKFVILSRLLFPLSIVNALLKRDLTKRLLVALILNRIPKPCLERLSLLLYEKIKRESKVNTRLLSLLCNLKGYGPVILLTASLDVIANKFKEFGFTCVISSPTFYIDRKLTGLHDLYGRKHRILRGIFSSGLFKKIIIFDDAPEPEVRDLCNNDERCVVYKVRWVE